MIVIASFNLEGESKYLFIGDVGKYLITAAVLALGWMYKSADSISKSH